MYYGAEDLVNRIQNSEDGTLFLYIELIPCNGGVRLLRPLWLSAFRHAVWNPL